MPTKTIQLSPTERTLAEAQAALADAQRRVREAQQDRDRINAALEAADAKWRDRVHQDVKFGRKPDARTERDARDELKAQLEEQDEVIATRSPIGACAPACRSRPSHGTWATPT